MSRYTHFILKDDGNSFEKIWSASYGSSVNFINTDISGNMYVAGYGVLSGSIETGSVIIYGSSGDVNRILYIDTSSVTGIGSNNITAAVIHPVSQSIYVANTRVLLYPSGSNTPVWSSSLFENLNRETGSITIIKLDSSQNIYAIGYIHSGSSTSQDFKDPLIQRSFFGPVSQSLNVVKWKYQSGQSGQDQYIREWSGSFTPARIPSSSNLVQWSEGLGFSNTLGYNPSDAKVTSSFLDYNNSNNAILINPTSSITASLYRLGGSYNAGFRSRVDSGSTYIASFYIKASGLEGNNSYLSSSVFGSGLFNLCNEYGQGGVKDLKFITSSFFDINKHFITASGSPNNFRIQNLSDGWNRFIVSYKISGSASTGTRSKELHSITMNSAMSLYFYGLMYQSSSALNTASIVSNYKIGRASCRERV